MTTQTKTPNVLFPIEKPTDAAAFFLADRRYNEPGDQFVYRNGTHENQRRQDSFNGHVDNGGMAMMVREPAVAGRFYSGDEQKCRADLESYLPAAGEYPEYPSDATTLVGGVVPHAGWICSGAVAAKVFSVLSRPLSRRGDGATIVLLGAVHRPIGSRGAVFPRGVWETPLGQIEVDDRLADRLLAATNLLEADPRSHELEHSIEVQIPFVQRLFPTAKILPIMIPPSDHSETLGRIIGRTIRDSGTDAVVVASSDLTHYGPSYQFSPAGDGADGIRWAKDTNDRRILDLIIAMNGDRIVAEATEHKNACGSGAIAAAIGACRELGATRGDVLEHTNSHEVLRERFGESGTDAVGYAGIVFAK